jgi:hypothetical protein
MEEGEPHLGIRIFFDELEEGLIAFRKRAKGTCVLGKRLLTYKKARYTDKDITNLIEAFTPLQEFFANHITHCDETLYSLEAFPHALQEELEEESNLIKET